MSSPDKITKFSDLSISEFYPVTQEEKIESILQEVNYLSRAVINLKDNNNGLICQVTTLNNRIQTLQEDVLELENKNEVLTNSNTELSGRVKNFEMVSREITNENLNLKAKITEQATKITNLGETVEALKNEKETLSRRVEEFTKEKEVLSECVRGLKDDKETLSKCVNEQREKKRKLKSENKELNERFQKVIEENARLQEQKSLIEHYAAAYPTLRIQFNAARDKLNLSKLKIDSINKQVKNLEQENADVNERLEQKIKDIEEKDQDIKRLEGALGELKDLLIKNKLVEKNASNEDIKSAIQELINSKSIFNHLRTDLIISGVIKETDSNQCLIDSVKAAVNSNHQIRDLLVEQGKIKIDASNVEVNREIEKYINAYFSILSSLEGNRHLPTLGEKNKDVIKDSHEDENARKRLIEAAQKKQSKDQLNPDELAAIVHDKVKRSGIARVFINFINKFRKKR